MPRRTIAQRMRACRPGLPHANDIEEAHRCPGFPRTPRFGVDVYTWKRREGYRIAAIRHQVVRQRRYRLSWLRDQSVEGARSYFLIRAKVRGKYGHEPSGRKR